ncbi:MAG: sulfatase-like hydrolase/transferase [Sphingopyxis sp.]|nr:sulfatase-like hydrolase/transferase [Sphingopyxis sp.]
MKISRRSLLASSAAAGSLLLTDAMPALAAKPAKQPNILFIMADDLGYADLSCYGRRDYKTPAIDRIAEQGMRFLQGYANSAVCSATRTALMTGRYQNRLPIGLEEPLVIRNVGLPPEHPTLPSILRAKGYQTALIGKWHLGQLPDYGPLKSGYDHFWGFRMGGIDYFRHGNSRGSDLWDGDVQIDETGYLTDLFGDKAVEMVGEMTAAKKPFFMSLHFSAPHWPWEGPDDQAEADRIAAKKDPLAIRAFDGGSLKTYAAMVTRMDHQIGRVMDALRAAGVEDDTIVVFTSDNGGERFSDTWPFSGKKSQLLEGGIRIPVIVRWPRHVKAGAVSEQVMMTMDWLPTLLAAAGTTPDPAFPSDGMDMGPVLRGAPVQPRTLCWRFMNLDQEACRSEDYKYLKIMENTFLFNVAEDPLERANLKERMPEKYAQLKAMYDDWDAQMLPVDPAAHTAGFTGAQIAEQVGIDTSVTRSAPAPK